LIEKPLRLYPLPVQELPEGGIYEDLELPPPERHDPSRPYVVINMVSSIDGKTTVEGKASRLGSEADRRAMRVLRSKVDAVMVGAGTLRAERLSLALDKPADGQQPLAIIVSQTGNVPLESNLIVGDGQEALVITTQGAPENLEDRLRERARVLRLSATPSGAVDLGEALEVLKAGYAANLLLVEGGPRLNHALISGNLADELFLTLAPKLLGGTLGEGLTILNGPVLVARDMHLLSTHLAGDEAFLRYDLRPPHLNDQRRRIIQ
jgi:2,5-diamino-6-(ribosylamino)-4(3H)-pyrimidinone 5'-phosphate reductase